jgi:hypothetical protein
MRKKEYLIENKKPNITYSDNLNNNSEINDLSYLKGNKTNYDFCSENFDLNSNRNNNNQKFKRELLFNNNIKNKIFDNFESPINNNHDLYNKSN